MQRGTDMVPNLVMHLFNVLFQVALLMQRGIPTLSTDMVPNLVMHLFNVLFQVALF